MGRGPPGIFGKRRVSCVRAGLLSRCLETPAWIRAQGSHHALPRSGGEPASTALGGGSSSLSVVVSRKSIAHIRDPHPERQKLRAAPCLPRRAAEREGCLQTKVGPLDSGGRRLGVPVARRAVPPGGEGSLHQECCLLPCVGARCLFGRHLQSCGLGDTEPGSTIFALSQFLPVYWVSNGREELAGVTLAATFPLTRGYERLFLPQFSSPDGEPWWNPPSTPGSQTGRSSLTPGSVLVLARPGLRSAPVLG